MQLGPKDFIEAAVAKAIIVQHFKPVRQKLLARAVPVDVGKMAFEIG